MKKIQIIGLVVFIVLIIGIVIVANINENSSITNVLEFSNLKTVFVATGGGKEDFIADKEVVSIVKEKYGLNVVYDSWSNGKLIVNPLTREDGVTPYDAMFCSDQRFYDYYKLPADSTKGEAKRNTVTSGGLILNTPIVIYSWASITDALENQNIVEEVNGTYYIKDMNGLLNMILEGKTWKDIGVDLYGSINVKSTDPVTSSPGATYYGLLLSIMCEGNITEDGVNNNLPRLKEYYEKAGYMNNTPADLFESYLKMGAGAYPMIVDYEKSLIEFANSNPDGFAQVKDEIRVLYPTPTIWNSHCIASFDESGDEFYKVFEDKEISKFAWAKYGFRTGVTGGNYDVSSIGITGIPQNITSTVSSLKMDVYEKLIDYLGN